MGRRPRCSPTQTPSARKVDAKTGATVPTYQYATAHDLRRAFGTRWSKRVMPATLQKLMRHASIETTMRYYVEHNADDVSADLWAWAGSVPGSKAVAAQENAPVEAEAVSS